MNLIGMTETSPVATTCQLPSSTDDMSVDAQDDLRASQGVPVVGVEIRIADVETGKEQPWDGKSTGELQVRVL